MSKSLTEKGANLGLLHPVLFATSLFFDEMSKEHSCSSTCRRKENPIISSPICHYGERSVMRTAKTMKNRGKQFWGCSKYKNLGIFIDSCLYRMVMKTVVVTSSNGAQMLELKKVVPT
ncbi:hypothetical protein V8G54_027093 [Vigna mungo]|uniref:GRF-type domain-containing protein n=1 Tax=Vigna mungo TaxID=3915 RepID=A0AAQ3RQH6_VIGMU